MTRKDFEAIASALRQARAAVTEGLGSSDQWARDCQQRRTGIELVENRLVEALAKSNPRFDAAGFRAAARPEGLTQAQKAQRALDADRTGTLSKREIMEETS